MNHAQRKTVARGMLLVAAMVLAGCPADDSADVYSTTVPPTDDVETARNTPDDVESGHAGLALLASTCAETGDGDTPGTAVIDQGLRVSNTAIELTDCVILLEGDAGIELTDVALTGGDITIHDRDASVGTNLVTFQRVGIELQSLTIKLSDPDDAFRTQNMSINTSRGIDIRVDGSRGGEHQGGTIHLVETSLTATDNDAPIRLLASDNAGVVRLERSSIDTSGTITVQAQECVAELDHERLDCSAT